MALIRIDEDEWYPCYDFTVVTPENEGYREYPPPIEVTDDELRQLQEWEASFNEWQAWLKERCPP